MNTDTSVTFASLKLAEPILRALAEKNYTHPSPIQTQAIPHLLEGRDLLGVAQTGTGKTAAFALPILHRLAAAPKTLAPGRPRVLILTPTRELAAQIGDNIALYGRNLRIRHTVIFGGVGQQPQVNALRAGIDIVVATPGRLLDLHEQRYIDLAHVEVFVLDEADRMLDMGFAPDVRRIIAKLPRQRQSLLFSATMPAEIADIARGLLHHPVHVSVAPAATTVARVEQRVCHVNKNDKHSLLVHLLGEHPDGLALVFLRTKHGANRLAERLGRDGIRAAAIHGNKSQSARTRALDEFRTGRTRVLVATDIAARGIDVKGISLVVNFDIPNEPESYVHRIGRTARAGADGRAISLCDPSERAFLRDIQRLIRQEITVHADHPFAGVAPVHHEPESETRRQQPRQNRRPQKHRPRDSARQANGAGAPQNRATGLAASAAPAASAPAAPKRRGLFGFRGRR
ncbi:MAG: DEAD/DEAH box helicase [Opitutaceae bacterium]